MAPLALVVLQLLPAVLAQVVHAQPAAGRSNILLVLTDDQDIELNTLLGSPLGPMSKTKALLQDGGAFGTHAYVNVPICCPSRANILSGKMAHNIRDDYYEPFPGNRKHGPSCGDEPVEHFNGTEHLPCGCMRMNISSYGAFESTTYANQLMRAGYTTAYFGKYLNPPAIVKYCRNETLGKLTHGWPSGWDVFYGMCDQASSPEGAYYDVDWIDSVAGAVTHTGVAPEDYSTSVIGNKTVQWILSKGAAAQPFMAVAAVRAPHKPYLPPPWYADTFASIGSPRSLGSYNHSCEGKPPWMAHNAPLTAQDAVHFDEVMRRRWGALLAVDDMVEGIMGALASIHVLENTFVFYWSDHGYHLGSFRLGEGKMHMYEFDTRVPFMMRGPGIVGGTVVSKLVGSTDLAPTFLAIAGVPKPHDMDGKSLLPLVTNSPKPTPPNKKSALPPKTCTPDPCNGQGMCLTPLSPQCFCNTGYAGHRCESCAAGYSGWPNCAEVPWRQEYLFEYYPIQNYAAPGSTARINDSPDNTFRGLRVLNTTHNYLYAEITTLADWFFEKVEHYELYDIQADPFQLSNLVDGASAAERASWHAQLVTLYQCRGDNCP